MKIKSLIAIAALLLGSTSAFAQMKLSKGDKQTKDGIEYYVKTVYVTEDEEASPAELNTVSCAKNNFTGTTIAIPETVTFDVEGTDSNGDPIKQSATFRVVEIEANGFENLAGVTSLSIAKNVKTIGASAFEGCENLATVTFAKGSALFDIGDAAFAYTSIETIDFTNCTKLTTLGGAKGAGVFTNTASKLIPHQTNIMLSTVTLPTQCTTISQYAFDGCTALSTISLAKVTTVGSYAFNDCESLTSVAIGTTATAVKSIAANAFDGSGLTSVELGTLASAVVDDAAFTGCAKLATFAFNGITTAAAVGPMTKTSPYDLATVTTVKFQKYIDVVGAVATDAFSKKAFTATTTPAGNYNIYYNASTVEFPTRSDKFVNPFAQDAFGASTDAAVITLATSAEQFEYGFKKNASALYRVKIVSSYTTDFTIGFGDDKVLIQDKNNTKNYYYFASETGAYTIAKEQESGATVTVYQAYADVYKSVATLAQPDVVDIYMQPLAVVGGLYYVPATTTVIIKSNQEDGVAASPDDGKTANSIWTAGAVTNQLDCPGAAMSALAVKSKYGVGSTADLWFFNNPKDSGYGFTKYNPSVQKGLAAGAVIIPTAMSTASARVNIIWLDEEGATAIQNVKTAKAEKGAIYNLAGQKVNAAYKGVVIKDGKKYIQK